MRDDPDAGPVLWLGRRRKGPSRVAFVSPPISTRSSSSFDPAASANPELCTEVEHRADRHPPNAKAGERSLDLLRWGLIPHWAKDINGSANINAKAEGIESRPAFREAFQRRCCLVPVDNFYDWKKTATGKHPMRSRWPIEAAVR
jgi:putative SOS response-associated peptidase YedK